MNIYPHNEASPLISLSPSTIYSLSPFPFETLLVELRKKIISLTTDQEKPLLLLTSTSMRKLVLADREYQLVRKLFLQLIHIPYYHNSNDPNLKNLSAKEITQKGGICLNDEETTSSKLYCGFALTRGQTINIPKNGEIFNKKVHLTYWILNLSLGDRSIAFTLDDYKILVTQLFEKLRKRRIIPLRLTGSYCHFEGKEELLEMSVKHFQEWQQQRKESAATKGIALSHIPYQG